MKSSQFVPVTKTTRSGQVVVQICDGGKWWHLGDEAAVDEVVIDDCASWCARGDGHAGICRDGEGRTGMEREQARYDGLYRRKSA